MHFLTPRSPTYLNAKTNLGKIGGWSRTCGGILVAYSAHGEQEPFTYDSLPDEELYFSESARQ